jgi:hypothetical protein
MQLTAQDIITDRPDQTESSSTIQKSNLQLEAGILYYDNKDLSSSGWLVPSVLYRYGVTDYVEIRLLTQFETVKNSYKTSGLSDLQIGFKVQLLNKEDKSTRIAFLSHAIVPTAKAMITSDSFGSINKLAVSHTLSSHVGLGYNLGYDYVSRHHYLTYSMALGIGLSDKIGCFVEPYGALGENGLVENNFDVGFTFLARSNMQWDISYGTGINHKMNFFSFGFSWRTSI